MQIAQRLAGVLVLIGIGCTVRAQADGDSLMTHELEEVYVRDGTMRLPVGIQRIPLAAWRSADALNVADAGRLIPAAHVRTNSRGETLLALRGASDRQVSVFLDGAPLTIAWDQRVDLGLLPSGVVGGGTVAKGNAAARFGANGSGGVVNLVSRELANDGRLIEVDAVGSSPGLGRVSTGWLERSGGWSSVVAVQRTDSDGAALAENAQLAFSQPPNGLRTNSDYALTSAFGRLTYATNETTHLSAALLIVDGEKGVPPESHVDPALESVRFWRYPDWRFRTLIVSGETTTAGTRLRGTVWGGNFSQTIERYADTTFTSVDQIEEGDDVQAGVRLSAERAFSFATLRGIAGWQVANHEERDRQRSGDELILLADRTYREAKWTLGTEMDARVASRLTVTVGGGGDLLQTHETGTVSAPGSLSGIFFNSGAKLSLAEGIHLWGSAGRRTRFPSMRERYDDALGRFVVNPNLRPETAWLFDLGVSGGTQTASGEVVLFARRSDDAIEIDVLPDGQRQRVNLGGSTAYGVELVGAGQLPEHVRVDAHVTLLYLRGFTDDESDLRLTEAPNALGRLTVSFQPPPGLTLKFESEYTGVAYSPLSNGLARLDPSLVFNLRAGYRLLYPARGVSIEVFGRVNNLSDAVVLPQIGLPAAGRTFLFGLSAGLGRAF